MFLPKKLIHISSPYNYFTITFKQQFSFSYKTIELVTLQKYINFAIIKLGLVLSYNHR